MTTSYRRECPVEACRTTIPRTMAMCRDHWRQVPKPIRDRVWRTYREAAGSADHLQALEDAVAAVENREPEDLFG
jgi:hypothetical protein